MAWLHTEIIDSIGPLEYILNTPSHHRVHHSRNPEYIDKNYGGMLIIWDRLLGTFKGEDKNNPPVYGLVHPVNSFNPIRVQFHPWPVIWRRMRRAKCLSHKLSTLFYGPGWKPGGSRLGSPEDLPKIRYPVSLYDPPLDLWKKVYVVIHFGLILFFYHELTLYQDRLRAIVLNMGVVSLLASITSLGLMLDNKRTFSSSFELLRCLVYFKIRNYITPIMIHGLARTGLSFNHQINVIASVQNFFVLSALIISIDLFWRILNDHQYVKSIRLTVCKKIV